jgi:hypothetical protein
MRQEDHAVRKKIGEQKQAEIKGNKQERHDP